MLTEEEKQKIVEEEKLRQEIQKKEENEKNREQGIGAIVLLILFVLFILIINDCEKEDRKNNPEKYMIREEGIILIHPLK
jgi:hypothetical protein